MSEEQIIEILNAMAQELGVAASVLWEALLRQSIITGITYLIIMVFLFVTGVVFLKATANSLREWEEASLADKDDEGTLVLLFGFLTLMCTIFFFTMLHPTITALANPEYWAIQKIMGFVTGAR